MRIGEDWYPEQLFAMFVGDDLPGDIAEFGCYAGATSAQLLSTKPERHCHFFDTFEGMPKPGPHDTEQYYEGKFNDPKRFDDKVRAVFPEDRYTIHKGLVPDTLPDKLELCFAYVDMDHYEPTKALLPWLMENVVPGGIILCDDFCPGVGVLCTKAIEEFLAENDVEHELFNPGNKLVIRR